MTFPSSLVAPITCLVADNDRGLVYASQGCNLFSFSCETGRKVVANNVFDCNIIHGIRLFSKFLIVFGGKKLKIIDIDTLSIVHQIDCCDDLILDCQLLTLKPNKLLLTVGCAHNFLDLIDVDLDTDISMKLQRIQGPQVTVLFSMTARQLSPVSFNTADEVAVTFQIASGTAMGAILLWQASFTYQIHSAMTNTETPVVDILRTNASLVQKLVGHEGVIFKSVWSNNGKLLATVSDDRTVRVWNCEDQANPVMYYVGWGHVCRLWDVTFLNSDNSCSNEDYNTIYLGTCSEDGTVKIWPVVNPTSSSSSSKSLTYDLNGKCIETYYGHGKNVWTICLLHHKHAQKDVSAKADVSNSSAGSKLSCSPLLLSGGNDGSIKVWPLRRVFDNYNGASSQSACVAMDEASMYYRNDLSLSRNAVPVVTLEASSPPDSTTNSTILETPSTSSNLTVPPFELAVEVAVHPETPPVVTNNIDIPTTESTTEAIAKVLCTSTLSGTKKSSKEKNEKKKMKKKLNAVREGDVKKAASSGVRDMFISPEGKFAVIVMDNGVIWRYAYSLQPTNDHAAVHMDTCSLDNDSSSNWLQLSHLHRAVCNANVVFTSRESVFDVPVDYCIICSHPEGSVTYLHCSDCRVVLNVSWKAHPFRTINAWLGALQVLTSVGTPATSAGVCSQVCVTSSLTGICRVWKMDVFKSKSDGEHKVSVQCMATMVTGVSNGSSPNIATCMGCKWIDGTEANDLTLVIGDCRGGVSFFELSVPFTNNYVDDKAVVCWGADDMKDVVDTSLLMAEKVALLSPQVYMSKVHGTDPVTRIQFPFLDKHNYTCCTLGQNGWLNIYDCGAKQTVEGDTTPLCMPNVANYALVTHIQTLPVTFPDQVHFTFRSVSGSRYEKNTELTLQQGGTLKIDTVIVGGYQGDMYMVWDVVNQIELLRAPGGGWKRPHDYTVLQGTLPVSWDRAPTLMVGCCAPPVKAGGPSLVSMHANHPVDSSLTSNPHCLSVPYLIPSNTGHSKVSYCSVVISCADVNALNGGISVVIVGGEDGAIKAYECHEGEEVRVCEGGNVAMECLQEVRMRHCVPVRGLASAPSSDANEGGIVVAVGGKLSYSIWTYKHTQVYGQSGLLLSEGTSGSVCPGATQEHRALGVVCTVLSPYSSYYTCVNNIMGNKHTNDDSHDGKLVETVQVDTRYLIVICDSRGICTTGVYSARKKCFQIIEEVQCSDFPLLCCDMISFPCGSSLVDGYHDAMLVSVGDTSGIVTVWLLPKGREIASRSHAAPVASTDLQNSSVCVFSYSAHSMGANTISCVRNSRDRVDAYTYEWVMVSGGDDQSLCTCIGSVTMSLAAIQVIERLRT